MTNDKITKCPPAYVKEMTKKERGSFDFRSDGNIEIVRWSNNSVFTINEIMCMVCSQ